MGTFSVPSNFLHSVYLFRLCKILIIHLPLRPFRGFYSLAKLRNINSHIQMKTGFILKKHTVFLGETNCIEFGTIKIS